MNSKDFLKEGFIEDASDVHLDHEVQMAREECYHAAEHALAIHKLLRNISEQQGLEGWVSSKITLANDYLNTVREHLEYELLQPQIDDAALGMPIAENDQQGVAEGSLEEVDRRGFLKGMGATAVAGAAGGARADWLPPIEYTDQMTDKKRTLWTNGSVDGKFALHLINVSGYGYKVPQLSYLKGKFKRPIDPVHIYEIPGTEDSYLKSNYKYPYGRLRIDSSPAINIRFAFPTDSESIVYIIMAPNNPINFGNLIASAQKRILIDASEIGYPEIITFNVQQVKESIEQGVAEGTKCNHTMEGTKCPVHGLKECPQTKTRALAEWRKEQRRLRAMESAGGTSAGAVAGVNNPGGKPKSQVGSLFGGTYKQPKKAKKA